MAISNFYFGKNTYIFIGIQSKLLKKVLHLKKKKKIKKKIKLFKKKNHGWPTTDLLRGRLAAHRFTLGVAATTPGVVVATPEANREWPGHP